jgi:hypothetical protein
VIARLALLLLLPSVSQAAATQRDSCARSGDLEFICGMERPEDLARIPGTQWLIASGFASGAGLKLIDTNARSAKLWYRDGTRSSPDAQRFPDCANAPEVASFNVQGISLRAGRSQQHTLYATNHGGRESIEVFAIDASLAEPELTWLGCVSMPNGTAANSVATYTDGTILATVLTHPGTTITDFVRGGVTGGVYEWSPATKVFRLLAGTQLPGNNGIETARDDSGFFVVAFGWRSVLVYRRDLSTPARRVEAPGFMPDNIHWDDGRLILAGMRYDEPACGGTRRIVNGEADRMSCHRGYTVAEFDPVTHDFKTIAYSGPNARFNGVSAAVVIGSTLWLGSYQADRVASRELQR